MNPSSEGRFAVVTAPGRVELRAGPRPTVHATDALARVTAAGICGTDLHLMHATRPFPWREQHYPFRLGHEWIGRIEEAGPEFPLTDSDGRPLAVGDRIVAYPSTWACGRCYACRILLAPNLCLRPAPARALPPDGSAFADWFYLPEGSVLFRVPDHVGDRVSVLTEPLAAALRAFERSHLTGDPDRSLGTGPGRSLVVLGSGPIGALITALGKMAGCSPVIVIGGPRARLDLCRELGADAVLDIAALDRQARIDKVRAATPHRLGADAIVEAAGVPEALIDGIEMCRPGGTLVEVGHYTDRGTVAVNPLVLCRKDISLFGCWGYGPQHFGRALRVLGAHGSLLARLVTHVFPLEEIAEALETARRQECMKAVIEVS